MANVGQAWVDILPSLQGFGKKLSDGVTRDSDSAGKKAGGRFGKVFASATISPIRAIGVAAVGLFAVDKVKDFFASSLEEAREGQKVAKTTTQIIKATGGAAKLSADQVGDLSTAISNKTGVDDEAVQMGANLLLTFKNVRNEVGKGNDVFTRATAAAVDLSAAGFGSVDGSAKMLGKALNDPLKGISALGRAGVTFTDQQKDQIKTLVKSGKTLEAQKIIMGEVEAQVGGVAAASASASDKFKVSFGNFKEEVGNKLIPVVDSILGSVSDALPGLLSFGESVGKTVGPVFEQIGEGVKVFIAALTGQSSMGEFEGTLGAVNRAGQHLYDFFQAAIPVIKNLFTTLAPIVKQAITTIVTIFGRVASVVGPIIKQIAGALVPAFKQAAPVVKEAMTTIGEAISNAVQIIQLVWARIGPIILPIVTTVFGTVVKVIGSALKIVSGIIKLVLAVLKGDWSGAAKALKQIWEGLWNGVKAILQGAAKIIGTLFSGLKDRAISIFNNMVARVKAFWVGMWNSAKTIVTNGVNAVVGFFKGLPGKASSALSALGGKIRTVLTNALISARTAVSTGISNVITFFRELPGKIVSAIGNVGKLLFGVGEDVVRGLINGIGNLKDAVQKKISEIVNGIKQKIKDALKIGSPSKIMMQYGEWTGEGLAIGIKKSTKEVEKVAQTMALAARPKSYRTSTGGSLAPLDPAIEHGPRGDINVYPSAGMDEKLLAQKVAIEQAKFRP